MIRLEPIPQEEAAASPPSRPWMPLAAAGCAAPDEPEDR